MPIAYIGIGSNIDPEDNVHRALSLLRRHVRIVAVSTFYRTKPLFRPEQQDYYNGVVEAQTDLTPGELKGLVLRQIEDELRRLRTSDPYASRTIDLDLLIYDDLSGVIDGIRLPDPDITSRPFLALALYELAPEMRIPGSRVPIKDIAESLVYNDIEPLPEYTQALRREVEDESREG